MKRKTVSSRIAIFWIFAFTFAGVSSVIPAQETNRQRVIEKPSPTATPTPTPTPTASPLSTPAPTPAPVLQTLGELQSKIRSITSRSELRRGSVGVKIAALSTGKIIFQENAEKYLMPASNMKSFTVAAALERLSPNFRFVTSVYADAPPDASGTVKGNLTVFGRGDVSVSAEFYEGDYFKGLDALAERIAQAGVKRIEGGLVGDESYFSGSPIPASWEWDDLQWKSGAEVSALPLNDNLLGLSVRPSSAVGASCVVQFQPFNVLLRVVNRCITSATGTRRDLTVKKDLDQNVLEVSGSMPVGDRGFSNDLTVSRPAELFIALLKQRLQEKGVVVAGPTRVISARDKPVSASNATAVPVEIAKLESPPLSLIAAKAMKPSQNLYTETILWTLGEQSKIILAPAPPAENSFSAVAVLNPKTPSSERGIAVVQNFLGQIGIPLDSIVQWDGSGLSRHNLVTAASLVQLYTFMARQSRYAQAWRDSLPIGAVDGTLKTRFVGTRAADNLRGKTGTIDQVSALSGYVTTAAGEPIVFSIIVNGVPNARTRQTAIDEIGTALADFNGKIN